MFVQLFKYYFVEKCDKGAVITAGEWSNVHFESKVAILKGSGKYHIVGRNSL